MSRRVEDLPPCPRCGGHLLPLSLCDICGSAAVRRDLAEIGDRIECQDCQASNLPQVICDACQTRQNPSKLPDPARKPSVCPVCATFLAPDDRSCPACGRTFGPPAAGQPPKEHRRRRIRGEPDEDQIQELLRVTDLSEDQVRALVHAGYGALWKIRRAKEEQLAAVPGIGPAAARAILRALASVLAVPLRKSREEILDEEYECPLCGCVTSSFSSACLDCGAFFDEEDLPDPLRKELLLEGPRGLLAFYDLHLEDDPEDAELWYARALLLETMDQDEEAVASLDKARAVAPGKRKIAIATTRLLSKGSRGAEGSDRLRSMLQTIVEDAALDQEMNAFARSIAKVGPTCPFCDEAVPRSAKACPACGMSLGPRHRAPPPKETEVDLLDVLMDDLQRPAPEPEPEPTTPASLEHMVQAFEASLSPEDLEAAQEATVEWLMGELEETLGPEAPARPAEPPPPETSVPRVPVHRTTPRGFLSRSRLRARGFVNGAGSVNGRARVNGLTNGRVNGFINGRGHVNGFINGKGFVNGSSLALVRLPPSGRRTTYALLASSLIMAGVLGVLLFAPAQVPTAPIQVDGSLDDWSSVPALDVATVSSNPRVGITSYAALAYRDSLFLRASTLAPPFDDPVGYDGIFFFLDADGDPATGYRFGGVGAEYLAEAYGNRTVLSSRLYTFPSDAEVNWSRNQALIGIEGAAGPQGVELRIPLSSLGNLDLASFRIGVYADDFEGASSRSLAPLNVEGGAILLESRPLTQTVGSGSTDLLEIEVRATGLTSPTDTWTVSNFQLNATTSLTYALTAESVSLTRDRPTDTIRVSVQVPGSFPGDAVFLELLGAVGPRPAYVIGDPARAYVVAPPSGKRVDGLFADWGASVLPDADPARVNNSNVDILEYGAASSGPSGFFYVQVAGRLLDGAVPQRLRPPPPGSGGGSPGPGPPPARLTGEDLLQVYVDMNASDARGVDFEGIRADYVLDIRGQDGRVTSRVLYEWSGRWQRVPGASLPLAKNTTAIEGSFPLAPDANGTRLVFVATDWSGIRDVTLPATAVPESPPPPALSFPIEIHAPEFELVLAPVAGTLLVVLVLARHRRRRGSA